MCVQARANFNVSPEPPGSRRAGAAVHETATCFERPLSDPSAHDGDVHQGALAASPDNCIKQRLGAVTEESGRSRKPSPCVVFLPLSEPDSCVFSVKGDGSNARRLHGFAVKAFPRKCLCRVYLQTRGEVAERLKAAVC